MKRKRLYFITQEVGMDVESQLRALGVDGSAGLRGLVASAVASTDVRVADVCVEQVPYDLDALTTESRQRVRGTAVTGRGERPFSFFVKVLRSWEHHPAFVHVPEAFRPLAVAQLPWAIEPEVYRTALRAALPDGLTMPRTYAVIDLDATHGAVWIEDVPVAPQRWDVTDVGGAARLLGRFAVSPAVGEALTPLRPTMTARTIRDYLHGRARLQVLPAITSDGLWSHPSVATHFGPHRERLLAAAASLPSLVDELADQPPYGTAHGDASTRNLLARSDVSDLVMIDFGFLSWAPLGFDLNQLVLGQVQLGERPATDLPGLAEAALAGYVAGLADLGTTVDPAVVGRSAAICALLFTGISAIPFEQLETADPRPGGAFDRLCAERATMLEFVLDRLDARVRRPQPAPSSAAAAP